MKAIIQYTILASSLLTLGVFAQDNTKMYFFTRQQPKQNKDKTFTFTQNTQSPINSKVLVTNSTLPQKKSDSPKVATDIALDSTLLRRVRQDQDFSKTTILPVNNLSLKIISTSTDGKILGSSMIGANNQCQLSLVNPFDVTSPMYEAIKIKLAQGTLTLSTKQDIILHGLNFNAADPNSPINIKANVEGLALVAVQEGQDPIPLKITELNCTSPALTKEAFAKQDLNTLRGLLGKDFNINETTTRTIAEVSNQAQHIAPTAK